MRFRRVFEGIVPRVGAFLGHSGLRRLRLRRVVQREQQDSAGEREDAEERCDDEPDVAPQLAVLRAADLLFLFGDLLRSGQIKPTRGGRVPRRSERPGTYERNL